MATTIEEMEVIQLPFRVSEWDEDGLVALSRNFSAIEEMLGRLQIYMNEIGFSVINGTYNGTGDNGSIVLTGLDAAKPALSVRGGRWFYWATDTRKLYLLKAKVVT